MFNKLNRHIPEFSRGEPKLYNYIYILDIYKVYIYNNVYIYIYINIYIYIYKTRPIYRIANYKNLNYIQLLLGKLKVGLRL